MNEESTQSISPKDEFILVETIFIPFFVFFHLYESQIPFYLFFECTYLSSIINNSDS